MEFLLCLATEARHAHNASGSNVTSDGVDLVAFLFLYNVGNRTRCDREIYRDRCGIIVTAQIHLVDGIKSRFCRATKNNILDDSFNYMLEVYMDDYIVLAIPRSRDQLHHISNAIMKGIRDVFPPDKYDKKDVISLKKL